MSNLIQTLSMSLADGGLVAWVNANKLVMVMAMGVMLMMVGIAMPIIMKIYGTVKANRMKKKLAKQQQDAAQKEAIAKADTGAKAADDAVKRARLSALRNSFHLGIKRYKAAGKSLYAMPWVVTLGEPNAGKSEAIRHSEIGFPGGLTDERQGEGETQNLNWWFTEKGVILDTAGRMIFESGSAATSQEWIELLKLLKKYRHRRPISGVVVMLSTESLLMDTEKQTREKAGRLNRQLNMMHQQLGVRFPVYVMLTKCDLITGFREFFNHMDAADPRRQMVGWSYSGGLDDPFNPSDVKREFERLEARLVEYRSSLLMSEDGWALGRRRTDHFDAVYEFPRAVKRVVPNLMVSLEIMFSQAEWTGQSMFLRGVYLTSAMKQGHPIDTSLLERFGESADQGVEVQDTGLDSSTFLRDVFAEKIFPEKGLVTTADSVIRKRRHRSMAIMFTAVGVSTILILLTLIGRSSLASSSQKMLKTWQEAYNLYETGSIDASPLIVYDANSTDYVYDGTAAMKGSGNYTRSDYYKWFGTNAMRSTEVPLAFRFSGLGDNTLEGDLMIQNRRLAYEKVFLQSKYLPAVGATRNMINSLTHPWNTRATLALAELMRLEQALANQSFTHSDTRSIVGDPELSPLIVYALDHDPSGLHQYNDRDQSLTDESMNWLYPQGLNQSTLSKLEVGSEASIETLNNGLKQFLDYWKNMHHQTGMKVSRLIELYEAIEAFLEAESELLALESELKQGGLHSWSTQRFEKFRTQWDAAYQKVQQSKVKIDQANESLADTQALSIILQNARAEMNKNLDAQFSLLHERTAVSENLGSRGPGAARLLKMHELIRTSQTQISSDLNQQLISLQVPMKNLDKSFWYQPENSNKWLYELRFEVYESMNTLLNDKFTPEIWNLANSIQDADANLKNAVDSSDTLIKLLPKGAETEQIGRFSDSLVLLVKRKMNYDIIDGVMNAAPSSETLAKKQVEVLAASQGAIYMPPVPMTALNTQSTYDNNYHPIGASELIKMWTTLGTMIKGTGKDKRLLLDRAQLFSRYQRLNRVMVAYQNMYISYWDDTIRSEVKLNTYDTWADMYADLSQLKAFQVNGAIREINLQIKRSLLAVAFDDIGAQQRAKEAIASVEAEIALLTGPFDSACRSAIASWTSLTGSAVTARSNILNMKLANFRKDILILYSAKDKSHVDYWNNMTMLILRTLGDSSDEAATLAIQDLADSVKAWPVMKTNDRAKELTQDEMNAAGQKLAQITSVMSLSTKNAKAVVIGLGARTGDDDVDYELDRLIGLDIVDGVYQQWFRGMGEVINALESQTPKLTWTLVVPDTAQQEKVPAIPSDLKVSKLVRGSWRFRYFDMQVNKKALGTKMESEFPDGKAAVIKALTGAGDLPGLTFNFYEHSNSEQASAQVVFKSTWSILDLLMTEGTIYDEKTKQYLVPLIFQDKDGNYCYYWIGVNLSRPLPPLSEWPSIDNWPRTLNWPKGGLKKNPLNNTLNPNQIDFTEQDSPNSDAESTKSNN